MKSFETDGNPEDFLKRIPVFPDAIKVASETHKGDLWATRYKGIIKVLRIGQKMGNTGKIKDTYTTIEIDQIKIIQNFKIVDDETDG